MIEKFGEDLKRENFIFQFRDEFQRHVFLIHERITVSRLYDRVIISTINFARRYKHVEFRVSSISDYRRLSFFNPSMIRNLSYTIYSASHSIGIRAKLNFSPT